MLLVFPGAGEIAFEVKLVDQGVSFCNGVFSYGQGAGELEIAQMLWNFKQIFPQIIASNKI
jgi:hypothetical protein